MVKQMIAYEDTDERSYVPLETHRDAVNALQDTAREHQLDAAAAMQYASELRVALYNMVYEVYEPEMMDQLPDSTALWLRAHVDFPDFKQVEFTAHFTLADLRKARALLEGMKEGG